MSKIKTQDLEAVPAHPFFARHTSYPVEGAVSCTGVEFCQLAVIENHFAKDI